jgi:hypothetical protein
VRPSYQCLLPMRYSSYENVRCRSYGGSLLIQNGVISVGGPTTGAVGTGSLELHDLERALALGN